MKAFIGTELLRKLPPAPCEVRDTKLPGFALRVRPSGNHSWCRRTNSFANSGDAQQHQRRIGRPLGAQLRVMDAKRDVALFLASAEPDERGKFFTRFIVTHDGNAPVN